MIFTDHVTPSGLITSIQLLKYNHSNLVWDQGGCPTLKLQSVLPNFKVRLDGYGLHSVNEARKYVNFDPFHANLV